MATLALVFTACQAFVDVYHVQTMYNIKQAAARAGVSVPVLRAWERRYGIVAPERSASGYRQFDDEAVARVRAMRQLVAEGWSPSAAAAAIVEGRVPIDGLAEPASEHPGEAASGAAGEPDRAGPNAADLTARFVAAAGELDVRTIDATLDDMVARGSFERVATDVLFPALERLGDAWATGAVSVAGEHLASGAVLRRLGLALDAAGPGDPGAPGVQGRVIVGLPPSGRHELGALAFAVAARRAGLAVAYLGADLPVADWVSAAEGAAAAVIGVVTARDRRASLEVARALRAAHPGLVITFGGRAAPDEPGILHLGGPLPGSVAALSRSLQQAP